LTPLTQARCRRNGRSEHQLVAARVCYRYLAVPVKLVHGPFERGVARAKLFDRGIDIVHKEIEDDSVRPLCLIPVLEHERRVVIRDHRPLNRLGLVFRHPRLNLEAKRLGVEADRFLNVANPQLGGISLNHEVPPFI